MLAVAVMFGPQTGRASDEDATTSVYLEFDPATGDFKTVHDNNRSKQRAQNQADDRSLLHPIQANGDQAPQANARGPDSASDTGSSTPVIIGAVVLAAVLLGIALAWIRRSKHKAH